MKRPPYRRSIPPGAVRASPHEEITEELEFYLDLRTEELIREGFDPVEARSIAEERFGDRSAIERTLRRQHGRRQRREGWMRYLRQMLEDGRFALRSFRRSPAFILAAVLTLALAVAGNTTILSVLDAAVLRALPFPDPHRLVFINGYHLSGGEVAVRYASVPEFRDWRERSRTLDPMVAVDAAALSLTSEGGAERIIGELVSAGFFQLLRGVPLLGRTFTAAEAESPDGYPLAIISHDLWHRRFAGDEEILGRTLRLNDRAVTVVGVMPSTFRGVASDVDVWLPLGMISLAGSAELLETRGDRFLGVVGRLAPGATIAGAQRELDAIARDLQAAYPDLHRDRWAQVQSFRDGYLGDTGRLLWVLVAAGGVLLAIAGANVANLLLVRAHSRTPEVVLRRAVGADSGRVVRQLLTESVLLAALGGGVGLVLAWWGIDGLAAVMPPGVLPDFAVPGLSGKVFLLSLSSVALVGLIAGAMPAVMSARVNLSSALRAGGRGSTGWGIRGQQGFVVLQIGMALVLLAGAGLLARSLQAQLGVDPGLEMEGVHVFRLDLPRERYSDGAALRAFTREVVDRVGEIPGLSKVAASSDFPFRGRSMGSYIVREDDPGNRIRYHRHSVTPGYFENLGVRLLRGRTLEAGDREDAPGAVVVTQALVDRVFPEDRRGVGRTIFIGNPEDPANAAEIVGVVGNVRYRNLTQDMMEEANSPDVFFSIHQIPSRTLEISFHSDRALESLLPSIRGAVASLDSAIPIYAIASLSEVYRAQTATPRFAALLMAVFSVLALLLACVGVYGVIAFTVGQRASEIAVRRALGARSTGVATSVVVSALRLVLLGILVGGSGALLAGHVLSSFLFGVRPGDPGVLLGATAAMLLVAVASSAVPAWKATRRQPMEALSSQ